MIHEQTRVRVNYLVEVDKGIAPLVEAFNSCPGIFTTSSCEGNDVDGCSDAYVTFGVLGGSRELTDFVQYLSVALGKNNCVCDLSFTLSIEWYAGGKTPNGYLRLPHRYINVLADAIRAVVKP